MNNIDTVREIIGRLTQSTNALSAVGAALRVTAEGAEVSPEVGKHINEVLAALGARDALQGLDEATAQHLLAEVRVALFHGAHRLAAGAWRPGWSHTDPEILRITGQVSGGFPRVLQQLAPHMAGLEQRLAAPSARFLDVGVGVGILAAEMARLWPALRIVGIDVLAPALALAREQVHASGLDARIELREQAVQDLPDEAAFDLGWLPSAFVPGPVVPEGLRRMHRALRPGGWIIFASLNNGAADPLASALARLRTVEWGAFPWTPDEAERLLAHVGFTEVRTLPAPPTSIVALIVGRRQ